jgi:hypothetical protein
MSTALDWTTSRSMCATTNRCGSGTHTWDVSVSRSPLPASQNCRSPVVRDPDNIQIELCVINPSPVALERVAVRHDWDAVAARPGVLLGQGGRDHFVTTAL